MFVQGLIAVFLYIYVDLINLPKQRNFMLSFTAGILLSALLLTFIGRLYRFENSVYYLALAAVFFSLFFSVGREKATTEQELARKQFHERILLKYYKILHHITIGLLFAEIARAEFISLVAIAIPLLLAKFSTRYHSGNTEFSPRKLIEDFSIVVSYFFGSLFSVPLYLYLPSLAIVSAHLFYSIISMIKKIDVVHLRYSVIGLALYTFFMLWRFTI